MCITLRYARRPRRPLSFLNCTRRQFQIGIQKEAINDCPSTEQFEAITRIIARTGHGKVCSCGKGSNIGIDMASSESKAS